MTIRYVNGKTAAAIMLSREGNVMRVAVEGADDAAVFRCIRGTWASEDCEPVEILFPGPRDGKKAVAEADCICSKELAARLIRLLLNGDEDSNETTIQATLPSNRLAVDAGRFA